jgi:4'-phosphopantetheinyl transferase
VPIISMSDCVRCYFEPARHEIGLGRDELNVVYVETGNPGSQNFDMMNYITNDERSRADRFLFKKDRETYIYCHALLRLILAGKLNKDPREISFINGKNNKPELTDNPYYFNITHTRETFAIVISRHYYVGIDLEKIDTGMDFHSVIKSYFGGKEQEFILRSDYEAAERFFLLWTRKEALLKALGTGIIDNLPRIEVSGESNLINREVFGNVLSSSASDEHFIYSAKLGNYYLSVASPHRAKINIYQLNNEDVFSYLDL